MKLVHSLANAFVLVAWLVVSLYLFAFLIGGLLLGSFMAENWCLGIAGLTSVGACGYVWTKVTFRLAIKLGLRPST